MKVRVFLRKLLAGIALLCPLLGCAANRPAATATQDTSAGEKEIRSLLARFEAGVQKDDTEQIMSLYSPRLTAEELSKERNRVESAARSFRYSEYRLFYQPEELQIPPGSLGKGKLKLKACFSKPGGKTADDSFSFRRDNGQWHLVSAGLKTPGRGEDADLPSSERSQIVSRVSRCSQAILSGDMDTLVAVLSGDIRPVRRAELKEDLVGLMQFHKYQYFSSSYSESALEIEFGTGGTLAVALDFMYTKHDGMRGERKLRLSFRRIAGEWQLVDIERRDSPFWQVFGKIAFLMLKEGARSGVRMAR